MATALVVLYSGCTVSEVAFTADQLVRRGHDVVWWTHGNEIVTDTAGLRILPSEGAATDIVTASSAVDLMLVPGGDPASIVGDEAIATSLRNADRRHAHIAAICAGVLVLADAGILVGRHITHNYRQPLAPAKVEAFTEQFWAGAVVEPDLDRGVVMDDRLITALPTAAVDFATAVADSLGPADSLAATRSPVPPGR